MLDTTVPSQFTSPADDMGLGKTLSVLALIMKKRDKDRGSAASEPRTRGKPLPHPATHNCYYMYDCSDIGWC